MTAATRMLTADDVAAYRAVRLTVLQSDPLAFITTADEFAGRTLDSLTEQLRPREDSVTFGAFLNGELSGILTLARETRPGLRHRANIYGVGVLSAARGHGCGDALLRAALAHAPSWDGVTSLHLAVTETQRAARHLYERHGFRHWGTQPDALHRNGQVLAEHWLWCPLGNAVAGFSHPEA